MSSSSGPPAPNYTQNVDFNTLAMQDAEFSKVLDSGKGHMNFHDPQAVKQLTKSLLKRDFSLEVELPDDRLCPPVPIRHAYIRWLQELVDTSSPTYTDEYDPNQIVTGIDIGTGASCIYPLLGCSIRPKWRFAATDIDQKSLKSAWGNVESNDFEDRIRLLKSNPDGPLIPLNRLGLREADFAMCNPPFYSSKADMDVSAAAKHLPPSAVCTGAPGEMIYEKGGDAGFVLRMVEESLILRERVQWYTSMLGKFSSVETVLKKLDDCGVTNFAVTTLVTGGKTKRWAIAWSFRDLRPANVIPRKELAGKVRLPFPSIVEIPKEGQSGASIAKIVNEKLRSLDLQWEWDELTGIGTGCARRNVWSRAARRSRARAKASETDSMNIDETVALAFKIYPTTEHLAVRWLQGIDQGLFESFCGMVKRTIREAN
ncbi:hypothetical protein BDY21DRAFT_44521 [Lineolata rhizophorae]|uniref:U6 small nuclear RNA (adenine-(43)-N(6))-methyltransferase n=1 Tax=Lineolata rhizophorae TaxID=578093 RepID=A0A6A6P056_9PEZI|nr:hypothetical protein BDY21DRAFT_44521 [Lineolata rhizophorae]